MEKKIDKKTGELVTVHKYFDKGERAMVTGKRGTYYVWAPNLEAPKGSKQKANPQSRPAVNVAPVKSAPVELETKTVVSTSETININTVTAEELSEAINGIGKRTAKQVIELRNSLPGEKFDELDQLRDVKRVNWDAIFEDQLLTI